MLQALDHKGKKLEFVIKFNQFMQAAVPYILSLYFLIIFPLFLVVIRDRRKNRSAKSDFQKKIEVDPEIWTGA